MRRLPRDRARLGRRRARDRRRQLYRRRRRTQAARFAALPARARSLQDRDRRRSAHVVSKRVERVLEDARRTPAPRQVHLRDDRGAQGSDHDLESRATLRLQAHPHASHRGPTALRARPRAGTERRRRAGRDRARGRRQHARRHEPTRPSDRLGRRHADGGRSRSCARRGQPQSASRHRRSARAR